MFSLYFELALVYTYIVPTYLKLPWRICDFVPRMVIYRLYLTKNSKSKIREVRGVGSAEKRDRYLAAPPQSRKHR